MISFIIPAHNEALWIGKCLGSIRASMEKLGEPYEVVVVDDASTDATRQIAEGAGARAFRVQFRKVAAVRNAGAREARGEVFFFVDADTQVTEKAVAAALAVLRSGAAGGGCVFDFDGAIPLWAQIAHFASCAVGRIVRCVGGSFLFCSRQAYQAIGGFDESFSVFEDIAFCQALKRVGRFTVPTPTVVTSSRKLGVVTFWEALRVMLKIIARGPRGDSELILDLVYGRRAQDCRKPDSAA